MNILILAAVLAAGSQDNGDTTRTLVTDVCLPFMSTGEVSADNIALAGLTGSGEDYQTSDGRHLIRLAATGEADDGTQRRVCTVQARTGGFEEAREAVAGPLEQTGFVAVPDEPADFPVWTKGGVTATVHQNPGRATIVRVSWSVLDEEAAGT